MQGPLHFHVAVQPYRMHGRFNAAATPASPDIWAFDSPMEATSHISKQMHGHTRHTDFRGVLGPKVLVLVQCIHRYVIHALFFAYAFHPHNTPESAGKSPLSSGRFGVAVSSVAWA